MIQLPEGSTEYTLYEKIPDAFLPTNAYMITDDSYNAQGSLSLGLGYHQIKDHTGDMGGRMLLVNAAADPNIFFNDTIPGLCANTNFNFSAWVVNVSPPSPIFSTCNDGIVLPVNVQFEVYDLDGNLLAENATGNLESELYPLWRQFHLSFNTGRLDAVRLVMRNLGPGGCGNNLAIDDIQFLPCGPGITLTTTPETDLHHTIYLCANDPAATITAELEEGFLTPVFQWQRRIDEHGWENITGETTPVLTVSQDGNEVWYRLSAAASNQNLANGNCYIISDSIRISMPTTPEIEYEIQRLTACTGNPTELQPADIVSDNGMSLAYQWYEKGVSGNWLIIPDASDSFYTPPSDEIGIFGYQRRAENPCIGDFPVNEYVIEYVRPETVEFDNEISRICLDAGEFVLTGGTPERFSNGQPGIYSGPGVVNGVFFPQLVGVGEYTLLYSPPEGFPCNTPATATIQVDNAITFSSIENPQVQVGQSVRLNIASNATIYQWDPDPTLDHFDTADPIATPRSTTRYRVTAYNDAGCKKDTTITVVVLNDVFIPNSFTPNGDGANDQWKITGLDDYPNVVLKVFNRWGMLVYSSNGYATPWNGLYRGEQLPSATYYYTISSTAWEQPLSGSVTILW